MNAKKAIGLFGMGAAGYPLLEWMWRGRSHWTMALTGGMVCVGLGQLKERLREEALVGRCLSGALCITAAEFIVGCTVNEHYRMAVWDYSDEPLNVKGQVCAKYAALWALLCAPLMAGQAERHTCIERKKSV